jgi:hypothetical protein
MVHKKRTYEADEWPQGQEEGRERKRDTREAALLRVRDRLDGSVRRVFK